jgi:hypothetical protein
MSGNWDKRDKEEASSSKSHGLLVFLPRGLISQNQKPLSFTGLKKGRKQITTSTEGNGEVSFQLTKPMNMELKAQTRHLL